MLLLCMTGIVMEVPTSKLFFSGAEAGGLMGAEFGATVGQGSVDAYYMA